MSDLKAHIRELVSKAAKAEKSEDAMRFTQAACNIAHILSVDLDERKRETPS
jgi:hypothetical protein